jgi:hypothetical protein
MNVTTKRWAIKSVTERWAKQYPGVLQINTPKDHFYEIYIRLLSLPETATEKDIETIIGNPSWTRMQCDECKQSVDLYVTVGEELDYEGSMAHICLECLKKAVALAERES